MPVRAAQAEALDDLAAAVFEHDVERRAESVAIVRMQSRQPGACRAAKAVRRQSELQADVGFGDDAITQHTFTGVNRGVIANRISHGFGLRGPSLTVDSAQSSALVAVHLACDELRSGRSTLAVAAGINLNLLAEAAVTALSEIGAGLKQVGGTLGVLVMIPTGP